VSLHDLFSFRKKLMTRPRHGGAHGVPTVELLRTGPKPDEEFSFPHMRRAEFQRRGR
jgi:hypothetical protein